MVFNLRCRTCLCQETQTIPLVSSISIEEYNIDMCLIDVIKECASVEIPLENSKPRSICTTCVKNAIISYTFRIKCKQSQLSLALELVKNGEIKLEGDDEDIITTEDDIPLSEIKANRHSVCGESYINHDLNKNNSDNIKVEQLDDTPNLQDNIYPDCSKSSNGQEYFLAHIERHAEESCEKTVSRNTNGAENVEEELIIKSELHCAISSTSLKYSKTTRPCKKCKAELGSHREWKEHMKIHTFKDRSANKQSCAECLTNFSSRSLWLTHVRTAHNTYSCRQCGISSLRSIRQLKTHMARCHSEGIYPESASLRTCDICGKSYVSCESMFKHKRLKHANVGQQENRTQVDEYGISHCDFCQWRGTSADLGKHKVAEHANMKSIECVECKKMFFTNHSLRLHMLVHTGVKKHMCEVCGSSFALQSNLIIHKRVHTGEKPYKCDQCDKAFTQHSSLHVHKFTHTDKPTFSCDQCGATFFRKDSFRYHVKKHRSIDEWDKCEICDKKFKSRKLLKNHMIVHTGERNHQCTVCGKSFGRRSSLRTHMNIHTGEKQHMCLVCGRSFLQKHVLVTHMKIHAKKQTHRIESKVK